MTALWQTQEAKAKFSELIKAAHEKGDQFITLRGEVVAVVMTKARYEKLVKPSESLLDFFKKAPLQDFDFEIKRSRDLPRNPSL